jgi:hypothetical protein
MEGEIMIRYTGKRIFTSREAAERWYNYLTVIDREIVGQYHARKQAEASPEFLGGHVSVVTRKQFEKLEE